MKKSIVSMAMAAMMLVGTLSACSENNPYPGYEKNQNGLYYQFFSQNEGEQPQYGELVEIGISCKVNDSLLIPTRNDYLMFQEPLFAGDLFEGLAMMHKGDSASFIVNIDSTFKYLFRQTKPEEFKSTDTMRFEIRLDDFFPESEFAKRMAAKNIAKMKADYPEETANAAQELTDYLANNGITVEPTESGLYYVMTQEGNGEKPTAGQVVSVHYTGKLLDGTVFDSSVERGEPISIPIGVGRVIPGWDEGIMLMSKGEKGVLYIPYYLAYGVYGSAPVIPPFANLIFDVELIDIVTNE